MFHKKKKLPVKEAKDGLIEKKNKRIKRLEKELSEVKSKLRAYESAFKDVERFLRDSTDEISVEELIEAAKADKSLRQVQKREDVKVLCKRCMSKNIKVSSLPFGKMYNCQDCNHVEVKKDGDEGIQQDCEIENPEDH